MNISLLLYSNIKFWQQTIKKVFFPKKSISVKNLYLVSMIYFSLSLNSNIFAKTVGNYFGVDLVTTSINFQNFQYFQNNNMVHRHTNPSSKQSYGFNYSYAVNYNNFFLAPGIIYEKNNTLNNLNRQSNFEFIPVLYGKNYNSVKERYGIKLDFGYDLSDNVAIFATLGKAINYYKNQSSAIRYEDLTGLLTNVNDSAAYPAVTENPFRISKGKKHALFYGGGLKIKIKNNWYLTSEYNQSKFTTNNNGLSQNLKLVPQASIVNGALYYDGQFLYNIPKANKFKTIMRVYKLGISYNF